MSSQINVVSCRIAGCDRICFLVFVVDFVARKKLPLEFNAKILNSARLFALYCLAWNRKTINWNIIFF